MYKFVRIFVQLNLYEKNVQKIVQMQAVCRKYSFKACVRTIPFSPCSEKRPNNQKVGLFKRGPWRRIV